MLLKSLCAALGFGAQLSLLQPQALQASEDTLVIISPHRKSIQNEILPAFTSYYKQTYGKDVQVEWLDQGGTSDDVRFVRARFASNPKTIGIDVFWGGGATTFIDLSKDGLLDSYKLPDALQKVVPASAAGIELRDDSNTWYGAAISSFGIMYNKPILKFEKLKEPQSWQDLALPQYIDQIALTDPRRSGSASVMNQIVLQSNGFADGYRLLAQISANVKKFTHSSSDPIKAVEAGDVAVAMAIDFYASAKVAKNGPENIGFVLPEGQTVLDPDPIGILKGAPNRKVAERFVDFVLSAPAQNILMLPQGAPGGPKKSVLGRMAVNTDSYEQTEGKRIVTLNPFKQSAFLRLDTDKSTLLTRPFNDVVGAFFVDTQKDLKKAWRHLIKIGLPKDAVSKLFAPPVTEQELIALAKQWDDEKVRNRSINAWVKQARERYRQLQQIKASKI